MVRPPFPARFPCRDDNRSMSADPSACPPSSPERPALDARSAFAAWGLAEIPKLLTLQDRNPHSPTYGCFDRNHWHYRIMDFPTGMAQECVWPLALAWATDLPGNGYLGNPALREWIAAGIRFAPRGSHADGSTDDFFPFERAVGATAFSHLACVEAMVLIGLEDADLARFFVRRARWLGRHLESGRLSNHEALVALCLARTIDRFGADDLAPVLEQRLARLLSWQHPEGWFWEYEGCDLGYQTLTISLLAQLHARAPTPALEAAIRNAVAFTAEFVQPDGSFGGEINSRNTYNFFPHGFEIVGAWLPEALAVNDRVAPAVADGRAPCYSDDHMIAHHLWNYLLAARDWRADRPATRPARAARVYHSAAGLLIDRRGGLELYAALNKGGVFKLFRDGALAASDTGPSIRMQDGRTAVCHMIPTDPDERSVTVDTDQIAVSGRAGWAKQRLMGVLDSLILRTFMLLLGRLFPDLVRRLLQRMLITDAKPAPFRFERTLRWEDGQFVVCDRLTANRWEDVAAVGIGGHQTSIFVIQSRVFQPGQMAAPWLDLTDGLGELRPGQPLDLERRL